MPKIYVLQAKSLYGYGLLVPSDCFVYVDNTNPGFY